MNNPTYYYYYYHYSLPNILGMSLSSCIPSYGRYCECYIIKVYIWGGGAGWVNAMFNFIIMLFYQKHINMYEKSSNF